MKGGTIYQEGKKWVWKSPPYKDNGVTKRTRKSFDTREQAENQQRKFLNIFNQNENNFIIGLTVREAYEKWVKAEWSNEEYISYNNAC